jgi:HAD superfamily hydrolase (TIGR01549 family)
VSPRRRELDPGRVEVVSFDLDGTLVDAAAGWRVGFEFAFARLVERHPALADLGDPLAVHDGPFVDYMNEAHRAGGGREWDTAFVRAAFRELLARHAERDDAFADEVFEAYESTWPRSVAIYEETLPTLDALHGRARLVMISNGLTQYQWPKIDRFDLRPYFERIVISEEAGVVKPDAAIFAAALEGLGAAPEAAIHVGDSHSADVVGARAAGWLAAWIRRDDGHAAAHADPDAEHDADLEIESLSEIADWLTP